MSAGVEPASLDVFIETSTEPAATAQIVNPLIVMVKAPFPAICDDKRMCTIRLLGGSRRVDDDTATARR